MKPEDVRHAHKGGAWVGVGGLASQTWDGVGERPKAVTMRQCTCGKVVPSMEEHWKELENV